MSAPTTASSTPWSPAARAWICARSGPRPATTRATPDWRNRPQFVRSGPGPIRSRVRAFPSGGSGMAMNPLVKNGVAAAVLVGAGWWGMNAHNAQIDDREYQTEIERVKREFTERSRWVASVAKQPEYTDELQRLLKWYFAEITDVNNRFPGRADEM